MKIENTPEKNIFFMGIEYCGKYPRKIHKICYFLGSFSRVYPGKRTHKSRPRKLTPENTLEKNTIYIDIFSSGVRCRSTSRHESIPKGSVRFRCRHQGMHPMTSKNFPAGGAA